jgi:hypothetical protein
MEEERREILEWLHRKIDTEKKEDLARYASIQKIFELAPSNLTYNLNKFLEELQDEGIIDNEKFAPIYVELAGEGMCNVVGFRLASLDGAGFGPDETAIVLELG